LRRGRFAFAVLDLNQLISGERELVAAFVPASCRVETALTPSLPAVEGNRGQLRQLLLNLVQNGADALDGAAGTVQLATDMVTVTADDERYWRYTERPLKAGDYLRLRVVDSGAGMTAETVAQLCTPFFTTKQDGEGLGLAAVRNIVRDHRGGLAAESAPGEGTTVAVLLPPADRDAPAPTSEADPRAARGETVLLIDDEPEVRLALEAMLQVEGFDVVTAASGDAGLAQFAEAAGAIGLVLLDLSMPEMDGEEVLRRLRARDATVPVVVMSGHAAEKVMARFQAFAAVRFLQKPFTLASLQQALRG
jgi:CheY-like chemotaxis protein